MTDWRLLAACRGMAPRDGTTEEHVFFPSSEKPDAYDRAKSICAGCPVQRECRDYVAQFENTHTEFGMWGGLSPKKRHAQRRRASGVRCVCEECETVFTAERGARFCSRACREKEWYRRKGAQQKRDRYRDDPEFRVRRIEQTREWKQRQREKAS